MTTATLSTTSWCPGGAGAFSTTFSSSSGRAAGFVGWLLEYVYPLNEWVDQLVGDEAQVAQLSHEWSAASRSLDTVVTDCASALSALDGQQGKSIRALRHALEVVRDTSTDASEWSLASARSLQLASEIVDALHQAVVGALSELAGIAASLFDIGFSLSSLNPIDKWNKLRNFVDHVDRFVRVVEDLLERMFDAFDELISLLQALRPLIDEAIAGLRELLSRVVDAAGMPIGALVGTGLGSFGGALLGAPFGPIGMLGGSFLGGLVGGTGGAVLGDTFAGVASDWLASDPAVTEFDPLGPDVPPDAREAYLQAMGSRHLSSLTDFIHNDGYADTMGGSDRTVVDVKKVIGADGTEHWVVALPSTQDWNMLRGVMGGDWDNILADYPATNDLDTNVALMLVDHPELATQYQRGVYEAMRQAGVPEGAPVVYSGFSQGGILSAALAADTHSAYSPIGVVAIGAPVDRFDIPSNVNVVAFAHHSDPVAKLDEVLDTVGQGAQAYGLGTGNPVAVGIGGTLLKGVDHDATIPLPDPSIEVKGKVPSVHSIDGYSQSVNAWEVANPDAARDMVDLLGGTVVDHQVYTFKE